MAIVGRGVAVADLGKLKLGGYLAWLAWLFIHLVNIIEFENRLLVLVQWGWYYFSRNRAARLITGGQRAR
jgi:NADH dehydrogenase